ncbi:hypothetical protein ACFLYQ_01645 [Chloroflexota bacterium]
MPYCPKCLDEFQERVEVCPDCKVTLVKELPLQPENEVNNEPLVHIATAPNEPLGMMWKEILENEGIHPLVKSRDMRASMYTPSLLSRCEIHVLASQAKEAKQLLAPFLETESLQ